jgi:hypothetical protein
MTVSTLRPDATISHTGALTGAATLHAAWNDNSDASYSTLEYVVPGTPESGVPTFGDLTLPAGAVIKALAIRLRVARGVGAVVSGNVLVSATGPTPADVLGSTNAAVNWSTPQTVTALSVTGPLTDAAMDGLRIAVTPNTFNFAPRVYEAYADVTYVAQPVLAVDAITDPVTDTNQPTITWADTLDSDGGVQTHWVVRIFTDAQYTAPGWDVDDTPLVTSGDATQLQTGTDTSWQVSQILPDDTYRAYVRVAQTVNGVRHWSDWEFDEFTVNVDLPAAPTFTATADSANARIVLAFDDNAGAATTDVFEVERSLDAGVTWGTVRQDEAGYLTPTAGAYTLYDYEAPNGLEVTYRGRALHSYSGVYAASAWVTDTATWTSTSWWLKHPDNPTLNTAVKIRSFKTVERAGRQQAFQALGASFPVVVSDTRESKRGTVVIRCDTLSDQEALDDLLDSAGTLLLQSPVDKGGPDYVKVANHVRERAVDWETPVPSFDALDFVQVDEALTFTNPAGATGSGGGGFVSTFASRLTALEGDIAETDADVTVIQEAPLNAADPRYGLSASASASAQRASLQAWATALGTATMAHGVIPPGDYNTDGTTVTLPTGGDINSSIRIDGHGVSIEAAASQSTPIFSDTVPANVAAAETSGSARRLTVRGIHFKGDRTSGQTGLRLIGHYGAVVDECSFYNLDTHLDLVFCLGTRVRACMGHTAGTYGFRARSGVGVITGATGPDSGSNHTRFEGCRDYARAGQTSQFAIEDSSGVVIADCIGEGNNPTNSINWNTDNATGVNKAFTVDNYHCENTPSNAIIKTKAYGFHDFRQVWQAGGAGIIVDATGANAAAIVKVQSPYLQGSPSFKGDAFGCLWEFDQVHSFGQFNPRTSGNWSGGTVPDQIYYVMRSSGYPVIGGWQSLTVQASGGNLAFFGGTPAAKPTGVAVTAAGVHAALVTLGLIAA